MRGTERGMEHQPAPAPPLLLFAYASQDGLTALHLAAKEAHAPVVELLLAHDADVNAKGKVHASLHIPPSQPTFLSWYLSLSL